jgi:hypothetical protein
LPRLRLDRPPVHSACRFVVAGCTAAFAVEQAVGTEPHVQLRLTVHTVFVALATRFSLFALGAEDAEFT